MPNNSIIIKNKRNVDHPKKRAFTKSRRSSEVYGTRNEKDKIMGKVEKENNRKVQKKS